MDTPPRLASQIAAEHECRHTTAQRAVMVEAFAMAGKPRAYAASQLRLTEKTIRKYAQRFGVEAYQ